MLGMLLGGGQPRIWLWYLGFQVLVISAAVHKIKKNQLTDSILHFETLNYPKEYIYGNHDRVRRSLDPSKELHLNFKAHKRLFNLRLKRDVSVFSQNAIIGDSGSFSPSNLYEGHLHGDPLSRVHGFVFDDIFEGRIYFGDGSEFHIESSKQYDHLNHSEYHSVIFNVKDIVHPSPHMCGGIKPKTQQHMNQQANRTVWKDSNDNDYIKFDEVSSAKESHSRKRRATFDKAKTECRLYVRADQTYVEYAKSADRAMYMMTQAVKSVSHIYEATDFDQSGKAQGYSINIKRIEVISKTACQTDAKSIECDFLQPNIGVEKFLDLTSLQDHEEYCLAYMFAHRDFSDGVLGLAWIGDTVGAGGICDRYQQISGKVKSLNTGIVTNLNYGKTVAQKVTEITLAHEIGHNFGAQHDDVNSAVCSPGGVTGNYIMFPRATSGSDPNNYNFSSCSKNYIWPVIQAKSSCFEEPGTPICGNRIVEAGEQCDCGYANEQSCVDDVCCVPADGTNNGCKFSSTALTPRGSSTQVCSPSLGFCCDKTTCRPYASNNVKCADETDCSKASYCVSENYTCPAADKQPDKTKCNADSNVCINGACTGSLCLTETNKEECQCGLEADFCKVCCQTSNQTSTCAAYQNPSNDKLNLPPGSPCNQYSGYCDILYKCRQVDAEGPLSRLKKWLFSSETLDNIAEWTKEYWWACILIGLGLVLFMAGFIGCCSVHTPSSNPNKPKPRQMTLPRSLSRRNRPSAPPGASEHPPGYHTATRGGPPPYGNLPMEMR